MSAIDELEWYALLARVIQMLAVQEVITRNAI